MTGPSLDPPSYPEGSYTPSQPCGGTMPDDCRAVPVHVIGEIAVLQEAIGRNEQVQPRLERLRLVMLDLPKAVDVECLFEGSVDAQWSGDRKGNGEYLWTCPCCGSEREESREAGDDHPDL